MSAASAPNVGFSRATSHHTMTDRRCVTMTTPTSAQRPGRLDRAATSWTKQVRPQKRWRILTALITLPLALSACGMSGGHAAGELSANQSVLASCPKGVRLATKVDIDVSGSDRTSTLDAQRLSAVEDQTRLTAVCGGHLQVTAFSATSAATAVLYDGEIALAGATDNARLRQVPAAVKQITAEVARAYTAKIGSLTPGGSDIAGQYRLASEYLAQLGSGYRLDLVLLTDGFQTAGFTIGDTPLAPGAAEALASKVAVPKLPGASITVAGLGQVASQPPSSAVVAGVVAFYNALCNRTGAASCTSVTDYTPTGR